MQLPRLPKQSVIKLTVCLAIILASVMGLIYPEQAALDQHDRTIAGLRGEIEAQESFLPLFQEMLKKAHLKDGGNLVMPERKPWPTERTSELMAWLDQTGSNRQLAMQVQLPDAAMSIGRGYRIPVEAVAKGDLTAFRAFLMDLCQAPFIEHIERLQITAGDGDLRLHLKVWVALGPAGGAS